MSVHINFVNSLCLRILTLLLYCVYAHGLCRFAGSVHINLYCFTMTVHINFLQVAVSEHIDFVSLLSPCI